MGLNRVRLGELIELLCEKNEHLQYGVGDVRGVNNKKQFMSTKANLNERDLSIFQIVHQDEFVFNHRTSRNGAKFSIAYNDSDAPVICTEDYVVFRIRKDKTHILDARWLYMFFNRLEFDRYVITNSWGSATELYNWENICSVELDLPPIHIQQKYVDVYNAMLANQRSYERGLEDLKLVCDAYIEDLRRKIPCEPIGQYLIENDVRNDTNLGIESLRGLSTSKEIIQTKADMIGVGLSNYKVFLPHQIAYVTDTSRRGDKVSLGINDTAETFIVSSISVVFGTMEEYLLPEYLMLFLTRSEFDRYARFHSWGSARENFSFADMQKVKIPIPPIETQKYIVDVFTVYKERKAIAEKLKAQIKDICPILIKGSIEEGRNAKEA